MRKVAPEQPGSPSSRVSTPTRPARRPSSIAKTKPEDGGPRAPLLIRLDDHDKQIKELRALTARNDASELMSRDDLGFSEGYKTTVLHRAARAGDAKELERLLADPAIAAAVNHRDESGWEALHYAACVGQRLAVQIPRQGSMATSGALRVALLDEVCNLLAQLEVPCEPEAAAGAPAEAAGASAEAAGASASASASVSAPAAASTSTAEASARSDLEEWGVWVEVRWATVEVARPVDESAAGPTSVGGRTNKLTEAQVLRRQNTMAVATELGFTSTSVDVAEVELVLLHDSEHAAAFSRVGGRLMPDVPFERAGLLLQHAAGVLAALPAAAPAPAAAAAAADAAPNEPPAAAPAASAPAAAPAAAATDTPATPAAAATAPAAAPAAAPPAADDPAAAASATPPPAAAPAVEPSILRRGVIAPILDEEKDTMVVARNGPACMRALLHGGAEVNGHDLVKATALHKAVAHGDTRSARLLLLRGADHSAPNMYGDVPLHRAVQNGRMQSARMLLEQGAEVNAQNDRGDAPLHVACLSGHEGFVRTLLSAGATIVATNLRGWAPLHSAAAGGNVPALTLMLSHHRLKGVPGASLATPNSLETAVHIAARAVRLPALRWLAQQKGWATALAHKNSAGATAAQVLQSYVGILQSAEQAKAAASGAPPPAAAGKPRGGAKAPAPGGGAKDGAKKKGKKGGKKKGGAGGPFVEGLSVPAALARLGDKGVAALNETLAWSDKETQTASKALAKEVAEQKKKEAAKAKAQAAKEKQQKGKAGKAAKAGKGGDARLQIGPPVERL